MTTFNKDLSPIDQARIILRNYDKVVAERDELKKENERLNMLVEQKDVLYRNMLERMEAKNKPSAIEGEYVTAYQSTDIVPKIYKSVNTPRDKNGLVSGKPKTYYRTRYSEWVTEKTFVKQYMKIREKF
nr:MAG TPA: hypothetical protein [Caudoviricetes sp.]